MEEHAFILTSVLALQAGQEQGVKLVSEILGLLLEVSLVRFLTMWDVKQLSLIDYHYYTQLSALVGA